MADHTTTSALPQFINRIDKRPWIFNFDYKFVVRFVVEGNDERRFRMMNVPEHALAILVKRSGRKHAGDIRAGKFNSVEPSASRFCVHADIRDVREWDREFAFKRPNFIHPLHAKD